MDFTAALGAITRPFRKPEGYVSAKEEEAAAKAAAAKSTAPPPPAPSPQMGGVNLGAIRKREQAAGLKDGGVVRGPGTGTSDSIPDRVRAGTYILPADSTQDVRLSNGETKLPPEVLATIGAAAVEALRNVTHERAETAGEDAGEESEDEGEAPMFKDGGCVGLGAKRKRYADGGMVSDDPLKPAPAGPPVSQWETDLNRRNLETTASSIVASPERAQAQAALSPPQTDQSMLSAGAAGVPQIAGANEWERDLNMRNLQTSASSIVASRSRDAARSALGMNAPAQTPGLGAIRQPTAAPMQLSGRVGPDGRIEPGYADGGMVDEPVPDRAVFGLYPQLAGGKRTTYATDQALRTGVVATGPASFEPAPAAPAPTGLKMDLPAGVRPSAAGAGRGAINPAVALGAVDPGGNPASTNPPAPQAVARPATVSQPGAASATQAATAMPASIQAPTTTSADNIAQMQRAGAIYREMAQLPAQQNNLPAGYGAVIPPDRQAERNRRFDLEVMRDRGIKAGGYAGQAMVAAAEQGLRGMDAAGDMAAKQTADGQASFARETAETGRNNARLALEDRRVTAAEGEAAARGAVSTQQASDLRRIAQLQAKFETSKDPEERKRIREQILLAQGRDTAMPNRFTVIPGGQTVDPTTGQVVREPSQVLDNQTGQVVPAGQQAQPKFETGKVYQDAKGNKAKWDGTKFVPA